MLVGQQPLGSCHHNALVGCATFRGLIRMRQLKLVYHAGTRLNRSFGLTGVSTTSFAIAQM